MVMQVREGGKEVRGLVHFRQLCDRWHIATVQEYANGNIRGNRAQLSAIGSTLKCQSTTDTMRSCGCYNTFASHYNDESYSGHRFCIIVNSYNRNGITGNISAHTLSLDYHGNMVEKKDFVNPSVSDDENLGVVLDASGPVASAVYYLYAPPGETLSASDYFTIDGFMVFDLTAMFADCSWLMPTTVAEFKALFPAEYYEYTEEPYDVYI